jgi:hypothetical protein
MVPSIDKAKVAFLTILLVLHCAAGLSDQSRLRSRSQLAAEEGRAEKQEHSRASLLDQITTFLSAVGPWQIWHHDTRREQDDIKWSPNKGVTTVWIPSWPRSGSTTIFKMVLAAAKEEGFEAFAPDLAKGEDAILEDRGRGKDRVGFQPEAPPTEPGCYVVQPSGCPNRSNFNGTVWTRDNYTGSSDNVTACEARRSMYNKWCGAKDSAMLFVPEDTYSASPVKRHFGFFEPCHKPLGSKTKGDIVSGELEGNCSKVLERFFRCDFTGTEYLWGWNRPHTDITGVSAVGARAPEFSPILASDTCAKADLVVYKTVDEFGRNASDVVNMLDAQKHVRAVIPVRDPRAIYASWKELPWDFEGVGLLRKICDEMAEDINRTHSRLTRVVFERLVDKPHETMKAVFKFLGLKYGPAQDSWIEHTFNAANCSESSKGVRFTTCHEDSEESLTRWRSVLSNNEKSVFREYPACVKTAKKYGYEI